MPPIQPLVEDLACILHKCRKERNLVQALRLHAYMLDCGLEAHTSLGNSLVSMLVEVGSMCHAQHVFDRLVNQDESSWSSLIMGYVKDGELQHALTLYQKMHQFGSLRPNGYAFVSLLRACATLKNLESGSEIHAEIAEQGLLQKDVFIGSTLVDMYAKCGSLTKAKEVFDKLPTRNVVSWTALIAGYAQQGRGEEALFCLEQMQHQGISPTAVTFICSLKACGSIGSEHKGREIHAEVVRKGFLERDAFVSSTLVDMYAKCGLHAEAQEVLGKLLVRDVVSWTALIAGYAESGQGEEALACFEQMQHEGISPNATAFVSSLKACGSTGARDKGAEIHAEITRKGMEKDLFVGNTLVDMYAKCGSLAKAQQVFDKLLVRDVVSWNALIAGYVEHGRGEEALSRFEQMQHEGVSPNSVTFVCILKACANIGVTDKVSEVHAEIARKGLEGDLFIESTLVDMYAKCGLLAEAQEVFDKLPVRIGVSTNALIAGYTEHGHDEEALNCFEQMQHEGISPDAVTLVCSLKACGSIGATVKGREIHAMVARKGLEKELHIANTLVDMYAKCGSHAEAHEVFNFLPVRDVFSWTALITGYLEHGHADEALNCFEQMQLDGISLDAVTLVCILTACGSIRATVKGRKIHAEIARRGLERELFIGNTLVDMYAKCGWLAEAQELFDKLPDQDVVSWNVLIAGYADDGHGEEALHRFEQMQQEGVSSNAVTLVCSLTACGSIGVAEKGQEIHAEIARKGFSERDVYVGSTLVDMYSKCGLLAAAQDVFDKLPTQPVVTWNALIAGYAQLGESENVFYIFDRMIGGGIKPDPVTFVSVLNACSHAGLVDKGQMYFEAIIDDYGFIPTLEHYSCMVDLLGRAGCVVKALAMIKKMPLHPGIVLWLTVLGACRKWGNVELGRHAFEHALRLDEKDAAAYVCMSNIYADAALQEDANKVEVMRVEKQAWKTAGLAWWMDAPSR